MTERGLTPPDDSLWLPYILPREWTGRLPIQFETLWLKREGQEPYTARHRDMPDEMNVANLLWQPALQASREDGTR